MRLMMAAAMAALAMRGAGERAAGQRSFAAPGRSRPTSYGNEQFGVIMSGAAMITATAPNRYDVRLIANELIVQRESERSRTC